MTNKKSAIHTVPTQKGWANKQSGKVISNHFTKATAKFEGRKCAIEVRTEHVVHKANGVIGEKNSYGNDPCPPKDKR